VNREPVFEALEASPVAISKTEKLVLSVRVSDPDRDSVRITWGASHGLLSATKGHSVEWRPLRFDGSFVSGRAILLAVADDNRGGLTTGALNVLVHESGSAHYEKTPTYQGPPLDYIAISNEALSLPREASAQIKARAWFKDGSSQEQLFWFSSLPEAVTVTQNGVVKRIGAGEARIFVLSEADFQRPRQIIVAESPSRAASTTSAQPEDVSVSSDLGQVQDLQFINITTQEITLTWKSVPGAQSYQLYQNSAPVQNAISEPPITLKGLLPGTAYTFAVGARHLSKVGPLSPSLAVTTPQLPSLPFATSDLPLPEAPEGLKAVAQTATTLALQWQTSPLAQIYHLYLDGKQVAAGIAGTAYVLTRLQPNTPYGIQVSSVNPRGESPKSPLLPVRTTLLSLSAPTGLQASQITPTSFRLTWNPVSEAEFYKLYRGDQEIRSGISGLEQVISNLAPNTAYLLRVSAVNASGESEKSLALTVTTAPLAAPLTGTLVFEYNSSIGQINADGTELRSVAIGSYFDVQGSTVVYHTGYGAQPQIMKTSLNGGTPSPLSLALFSDTEPVLSPNGQTVAFISSRNASQGSTYDVYTMDLQGMHIRQLCASNSFESNIDWAPQGDQLVYESERDGNFELYRVSADGSAEVRLTQNTLSDLQPTWSPDGSKIAFLSALPGRYEIFTIAPNGTERFRVTNQAGEKSDLHWSPDGSQLLFQGLVNGKWQIFKVFANGTGLSQLTSNDYRHFSPSWSPDGKHIAFLSLRNDQVHLFVSQADGSDERQLTTNALGTAVNYRLKQLKWLP